MSSRWSGRQSKATNSANEQQRQWAIAIRTTDRRATVSDMSISPASIASGQAPPETPLDLLKDENTYPSKPSRWCDLVMKGGVTSAIVYPLAICELARAFRFKNIGGTSAGAIAAAGCAAAELRRQREGTGKGFAEAASLPQWVGEGSHLLALFQPQRETEPLFNIFAAATDQQDKKRKITAVLKAFRGFTLWLLAGALLGLAITAICSTGAGLSIRDAFWSGDFHPFEFIGWILLTLVGLALAAIGGLVGVGWGIYRRADQALPENFYGLTTGYGSGRLDDVPPLTVWLTGFLNDLAGLPTDGPPLTFGHLWGVNPELTSDELKHQ
jgi:hypothetical protein